jgi:hypothetical protein
MIGCGTSPERRVDERTIEIFEHGDAAEMVKAFTLARRFRPAPPAHHPTLRFTQFALSAAFAPI